jgi:RHH-type proline utilization regulon transcriptional repressor/proline dehydrogenase/delta 1-pyrroline-5-carboxylate dehydrogenase
VKVGVARGSRSHRDEWFGPLLGVMAADDLDHAIALQNEPAFGLTGGIQSLDPTEIERWLDRVEVGNAYVNRAITGAIVGRQPFGGWKRSVVGPGAKAGGPGYVASLCRWTDRPGDRIGRARRSYAGAWAELGREVDLAGLRCEANVLRHRPLPGVVLRIGADADPADVELCEQAAALVGTPVERSDASTEDQGALIERLATTTATRLRVLGEPLDDGARRAAHRAWIDVMDDPPVAEGRVELRRWVREQSISRTRHRYGMVPPDGRIGGSGGGHS